MNTLVCIVCPNGCTLDAEIVNGDVRVSGNKCARGIAFAKEELIAPMRSLTTTVATVFPSLPVVSVRTNGEIPKGKLMDAMKLLNTVKLEKKLHAGEVILPDLLGTGVDVLITTDMFRALRQ